MLFFESCLPFVVSGLSKSLGNRCLNELPMLNRISPPPLQAPSMAAPILCVAPHSTFFDALAVAVMGAPSVVAKAETKNVPFFGSLIRCGVASHETIEKIC